MGVNGTGKTTTVGKLAHFLRGQGRSVLVCAADTFRAAAVEQLAVWTERAGVDLIRAQAGADPAAVAFQGLSWWLVHASPATFLGGGWHLLLIGLTLLFSVNYLLGGVRLLQRRQGWIVSRHAQERLES